MALQMCHLLVLSGEPSLFEKSMSRCLFLGPGDGIVSSLERGKRQGAVARPHEDCRGS